MFNCVICKQDSPGVFGHNPAPISDHGRACDECNDAVILARMRELVPSGSETMHDIDEALGKFGIHLWKATKEK